MSSYEGPRTRLDDATARPMINRSYWWNTSQSPKPAPPAYSSGPALGLYREMRDSVSSDFRRRIAQGEIINRPMGSNALRSDLVSYVGPHFAVTLNGVTYNGEYEGVLDVLHSSASQVDKILLIRRWCDEAGIKPDLSALRGLVATKARAGVASPSFDGSTSIGEARETLRWLRSPFQSGGRIADALFRKIASLDGKRGVTLSGGLAGAYMEFRYAVRPLVNEVFEALLTLGDVMKPPRRTSRAMQLWSGSGTTTKKDLSYSGILYDATLNCTRKTSLRAGILYEHVDELGLRDKWGLRISDIPRAAWDLVPLSFVYDWVGNVGDFISAITPVAGVRDLAQWLVTRDTYEVELVSSNYRFSGYNTVRAGSSVIRFTLNDVSRENKLDWPSLQVRGIDALRDDVMRLLDLIAIFQQKLQGALKQPAVRQAEREYFEKLAARSARRSSWTDNGPSSANARRAEQRWRNSR